ncbi:MAG: Acetolactate synthase small subunit [Phycisphaerae bacterium]|nr:Acetolactate synthase small subunit [Phycisphaerae bacterium]
MKHLISALVENEPGVLAHVAGMFAARGYNIDSLVVGRTEDPAVSRLTLVAKGEDAIIQQIRKQLDKLVHVLKVRDHADEDIVERDLMLISVQTPPGRRAEIVDLVELFRGKVVDIGARHMMIELTGPEKKIEAFINLCRPYGISSLARTGVIAMPRTPQPDGPTEEKSGTTNSD